jgi:ABC-type transporter Mla subunit MlaD
MNQELLLVIMTIFVAVAATALVIQMFMLIGIFKTTKSLQARAEAILPQVKSILTKAETTLDDSRKNIVDITTKANEMMDIGKAQLVKLDSVITDASSRAKVQLERAEMVVDDTVSRVHESVTAVHNGLLRPVREIQGIATGVRTAVEHFLRGGRPSVAQATQDDEMFI